MKLLRELHDFVAGGSIVAPAGLAVTIAAALLATALAPALRAALVFGLILITFAASTLERG